MVLLRDADVKKNLCVCVGVFPRYHRVQSALTQQNSELQDTRMLTEFLERVELEESQELSSSHYRLGQVRSRAPKVPLKREIQPFFSQKR